MSTEYSGEINTEPGVHKPRPSQSAPQRRVEAAAYLISPDDPHQKHDLFYSVFNRHGYGVHWFGKRMGFWLIQRSVKTTGDYCLTCRQTSWEGMSYWIQPVRSGTTEYGAVRSTTLIDMQCSVAILLVSYAQYVATLIINYVPLNPYWSTYRVKHAVENRYLSVLSHSYVHTNPK